MYIEIVIFIVTAILTYYIYVNKKIQYHFEKNGVRYVRGVPIFGNVFLSTFLKRSIVEDIDVVYKAFPEDRYVGFVEGTTPIVMIRDPELIKAITVKDFDHFVNHKSFFVEDTEPLFGDSLLMMKDKRWRDMRSTLSPAFSGSKMRHMMPFMMEISDNFVEYLKDHESENINIDDLMRRYTNDVIASAGFGLQVNSLKDRDNEFYRTGQELFQVTSLQRAYLFLSAQFPNVAKTLGCQMIPEKTTHFFKNLVTSTMEYRLKNDIRRPDMIQMLMEASKGTLQDNNSTDKGDIGSTTTQEDIKPQKSFRKWTDDELTSQVFIFFVAGFDSSATSLVMSIHELALNPAVQDTLYQEVRTFEETHRQLTYDNVNSLKYLDAVICESTRKWSPAIILDRVCTKAYELPPSREGGTPFKLNPGDIVYNVVNSVHNDPKYFPEPHVFDPDRFSEENKHKITLCSFLPFGAGPRNCIGSRFALLELKVILCNLILNFAIVKCEKTTDPIELQPADFTVRALGGSWVKFERRTSVK